MNSPKISAALATFNEKSNIESCIKSLKLFVDEIVIVDGNSQDKTAQIAKKLGAKVISTSNKIMFHTNKNLAIKNCSGQWIFLIDADERVTESLANEIKTVIASNPAENGFWVNRKNWFLGGYLKKGGAYPDSVVRLFRNGKGILPEVTVHEQVKIEGQTGNLKNDLIHLADPNFERYLVRSLTYTDETAAFIKNKNPGRSPISVGYYMILLPVFTFIRLYIRHKGYKDGFRGFIWAIFSSFHFYYAYVKYWQGLN